MSNIEIIQGDCLEVMKIFKDGQFDCIITDPPYKFETRGGGIAKNEDKRYLRGLKEIGVSQSYDLFDNDMFLAECVRVLNKVNLFIFCSKSQILPIITYAEKQRYNFELIPLCKSSPVPFTNNQWLPDREWGIHVFKNIPVYGSFKTKQGFFFDSNFKDEAVNHPCPKPVKIVRRIVENLTEKYQTILDPFSGGGSLAVAGIQCERDCVLIDIDKKHCETARKRVQEEKDKMGLFPATSRLTNSNHLSISSDTLTKGEI